MPKVSIVIPVYNVEPYLRQCLDSVVTQTYQDLEIILIDDGSPDRCGAICDEYAEKDDRIVVVHEENAGVGAARNKGLELATGDWITFVDPDDWIDSDYCEKFVQFIAKNQTDMFFFGGVFLEQGEKKPVVRRCVQSEFVYTKVNNPEKWEILLAKVLSSKIRDRYVSEGIDFGLVCSAFHNTLLLRENNIKFCTDMNRFEDGLFNYMMLEKASSVGGLPYIGYHYRRTNTESVNFRYIPGRINSLLTYVQKLHRNMDITGISLLNEAISSRIIQDLLICLQFDYFHKENPKKWKEKKKELQEIKRNPYVHHAIWQKENRLLTKKGKLLKICLRLPGVWSIKLFYMIYILWELLKKSTIL